MGTPGRLRLDVPRALAISLDARIFRPGSGRALDRTLQLILSRWEQLETSLRVAIGLRGDGLCGGV